MTKDGRPSRICDIRYFHSETYTYLKGHEDSVAFARRLAWFLNGEEFSLGAYTALYIFFTSSIESGTIQITDLGGDWWQRFTFVGVSDDFPNVEGVDKVIKDGTVAALKAIRPDLTETIQNAALIVDEHKDNLRFLLKTHKTKKRIMEVSSNISVWPKESLLFLSMTDLETNAFLDAPPRPIQAYLHAIYLAGTIKVSEIMAAVLPHQSIAAQMISSLNGGPISTEISELSPQKKPVMSKLVRPRG